MTSEEKRNAERDRLLGIVKTHCEQLREYFDNVHIFCNTMEEGGEYTLSINYGGGNWHARKNQVREFVVAGDAKIIWEEEDNRKDE